jgi:LmbE family N-acetylglucosaminyl deacetylase
MNGCLTGLIAGDRPRAIREGGISSSLRLLVVAPHPDDFDTVGVTLKHLSGNGNPIQVIVARTGGGVEDSYAPGLTLETKAQLREQEQRNSARFFGLPEECLTFVRLENDAEDEPLDGPSNLVTLEALVLKNDPDIIVLPHGHDTNRGHQVIYSLIRQIAVRSRRPLTLMLIRDPKNISMRMDLYLSFGEDEARWKGELLRFHDTQHRRNLNTRGYGFDKRILDCNRQIARELSLTEPYAEAFEIDVVT